MNFIEVFLGTYLVVTLIFSALFALIPAKVASNKGYSFGLWWLYGFFLWIIAMIHVTLITDLEAERRKKEASQIKPNTDGTLSEETMKKYNGLIKSGLVSQDEFGVKKKEILQTYVSQQSSPETTTRNIVGTKESLLKRANLFLEDGDWNAVYDYSETVLDMDPECAEAYLLKMMLEAKATSMDELKSLSKPLTEYNSYNKVIRFADENLKSELQNCNESIINKNMDNIYNNALSMMQNANTEQDLQKAISLFDQVPDYKDAKDLIEECNISINGIKNDKILHNSKSHMEKGTIEGYKTAIRFLRSISDWKNSQELIEECNQGIEAIQEKVKADLLEKERQEELKRLEKEARSKKIKKILMIVIPLIVCSIIFVNILNTYIIPAMKYNSAAECVENKEYTEAIAIYEELGEYKDSKDKLTEAQYLEACSYLENKKYKEAYDKFLRLPNNYQDRLNKINESAYGYAKSLMSDKKYLEAVEYLNRCYDYKDVKDVKNECYLQQAKICYDKKMYEDVIKHYEKIDNYDKKAKMYLDSIYNFAKQALKSKEYAKAINNFEKAGNYSDSKAQVKVAKYEYIKSHKDRDDYRTYDYLKQLKSENYKDTAQIFNNLYAWRVNIVVNESEDNSTRDMNSVSKYYKWYFHVSLSGGEPNGKTKLSYNGYFPNGSIHSDEWDSEWNDGDSGTCYFWYNNPAYGSGGEFTLTIYDEYGNILGTKSVYILG